jgi:hypothetical protein
MHDIDVERNVQRIGRPIAINVADFARALRLLYPAVVVFIHKVDHIHDSHRIDRSVVGHISPDTVIDWSFETMGGRLIVLLDEATNLSSSQENPLSVYNQLVAAGLVRDWRMSGKALRYNTPQTNYFLQFS